MLLELYVTRKQHIEIYESKDKMTKNGLDVNIFFVKKIIKAIRKEKYEAYIGKFEKFDVYVKRLSPRLIHKLVMRSKVR